MFNAYCQKTSRKKNNASSYQLLVEGLALDCRLIVDADQTFLIAITDYDFHVFCRVSLNC